MKRRYVVYQDDTGAILSAYITDNPTAQRQAGQTYKQVSDAGITDATHRVDVGLLTGDAGNLDLVEKTALPGSLDKTSVTADGQDTATISGLPAAGGDVSGEIPGQCEIAAFSDGIHALTFNTPGTYTVRLRHPLYLERAWEITAI